MFFCTEIAVEKHFDPPKSDFWRGLGGFQKIFVGSLSLAIFYSPLINYAVIQPLTNGTNGKTLKVCLLLVWRV